MNEQIAKAVEVLRSGGIILYPTDTVWGIGCDATNAEAVEKIYALKHSLGKTSMTVLVDSLDNVGRYVRNVPEIAWQLFEVADKPLTLVLPGGCGVAENLIPEQGTVGIRVPKCDFCQGVIRRLGRPLVSTSANISGYPTPLTYEQIADEVREGVDMVVEPSCESPEATHRASSIILVGEGGSVRILRD
ncbi:MAG: threonylcarbamoyl-AMP synthase [Rikenellaceae bacterium]|nr:threonylcarbamoyl-AMP synthase [Rikenellaceae bacterium]